MEFPIICPWCGYKHDGLDYIDVSDMDGDFVMDCEECEKQVAVEFKTTITFKTEKSE